MKQSLLIFTAFCLLALGCVTARDLERLAEIHEDSVTGIQQTQVNYQRRIEDILADTTLSDDRRFAELRDAAKVRIESLESLAKLAGMNVEDLLRTVETRTVNAVETVGILTGNPLIDIILGSLLGVGAGAFGAKRLKPPVVTA